MLTWSRYTALIFAIGLGVGEAVINWGHWQYAPLWIVDYLIVVWLLIGFFQTGNKRNIVILLTGWTFTAGVFYMALFISLDAELAQYIKPEKTLLYLTGFLLTLSVLGMITSWLAYRRHSHDR
jgi:hypothetical protein